VRRQPLRGERRLAEPQHRRGPTVGFEATFCSGNVFRRNRASDGNYGFWLGFSANTCVEENEIDRNRRTGVAIEHGRDNRILNNEMRENRHGIQLWTGGERPIGEAFPDRRDSAGCEIRARGPAPVADRFAVESAPPPPAGAQRGRPLPLHRQ
jgi:parallel beta-helix repeat protein